MSIAREDAPRYGNDILAQSRQRYEAIKIVAERLGIPLHVYMSRSTGSRDVSTKEVQTADVGAVVQEMDNLNLLPGSRFIVCDTDAVNDHGLLAELLTETRMRLLAEHPDIGVHLHVVKGDALQVQRLVRASINGLSGKRIYMETGLAGLGGCIILKEASANLGAIDLVKALKDLNVRILPFEPDVGKMGRATGILHGIKNRLESGAGVAL